ncbi:MAG TPA: response regulator [Verrucomicrobiae bacterium]|jgi:CheY-like chemotaxis protein|nr:response regulator [Verrucomicrobiae bacterium]
MKQNCSILLVEDDANDQYFVSRAFRQMAMPARLDTVSDGQSAIDFLNNAPARPSAPDDTTPGIVLLDLNLPLKSGLEVLKWIRQESPWKTLVVIVLTSSTSEQDMQQAYSSGANAYVIKPSDPSQLREFAQLVKDFWLNWNQIPPSRN